MFLDSTVFEINGGNTKLSLTRAR